MRTFIPGNSGGPLVNLKGEVVGINEISYGLSGAIPGNLAQKVARQLIEKGSVSRSWLGMEIQPLLKNGKEERGVLISDVVDDSPAAKTGIQSGDMLVRLAGKDVLVRYAEGDNKSNAAGIMLQPRVISNGGNVQLTH